MNPDELFLNAIFGGPPLSAEQLSTIAQAHHLPSAAIVHAQSEGTFLEEENNPAQNATPLHLHAGTTYWFVPLDSSHVPPQNQPPARNLYRSLTHLVPAIQQAILALRRRELALLRQNEGNTPSFSLQDEVRAFQLALHEIRRNPGGGEGALTIWVEIMLHRYQTQLNLIRLRLVELVTAFTRGHEARFAYLSASLIKGIYQEHRLPSLAQLARMVVAELAPLTLGKVATGESVTPLSPVVGKALSIMAASFREPISLAEVAAASHVSAAHLARLFRKETGHSVVDHLQRLRINHARELLATTRLGLLEIALESGFESIEHFHRLFRRITGTTPRIYRLNSHLKPIDLQQGDAISRNNV